MPHATLSRGQHILSAEPPMSRSRLTDSADPASFPRDARYAPTARLPFEHRIFDGAFAAGV
jgi:hypothetical protein